MRYLHAIILALTILIASCSPVRQLSHKKSDTEKVADFLKAHPELMRKDTVRVFVPFKVPEVHIKKEFVLVHDTIYLKQEASHLDSLINKLSSSVDSAQKAATAAKLHQLLDHRPVLRDTLCFDTLGIAGKIWRTGQRYYISLTRKAIAGQASAQLVQKKLQACPPAAPTPAYGWYNPTGWALPWWVWLLLGLGLGAWLGCFICVHLLRRLQ